MILRNNAANRRAFTLIELLMVISIIVVLVSMLLLAIRLMRSAVKKISCQSNLHQMHVAILSYSEDWNGQVMYGLNYTNTPLPWALVGSTENWGQTTAAYLGMSKTVTRARDAGIFNCAENRAQKVLLGIAGGEAEGSYTGNFDGPINGAWNGRFFGGYLHRLQHASEALAIWDGAYYSSDCWNDDGSGSLPATPLGHRNVRYAHKGATNLLFVDGHSESTRLLRGRGAYTNTPPYTVPTVGSSFVNGKAYYAQ